MWFPLAEADLDWTLRAPFRFDNEAVIDAPPERVFAVLADCDTWPAWFPDFRGATWLTRPPHGTGSSREVRLKLLSAEERFLAWEAGKHMAFVVTALTLPLVRRFVEDFRLEPAGEGRTRLRWCAYYEPGLVMRLVHPVARLIFGGMFREGIAGLTSYVSRTAAAREDASGTQQEGTAAARDGTLEPRRP
jgi:hypothetical protein